MRCDLRCRPAQNPREHYPSGKTPQPRPCRPLARSIPRFEFAGFHDESILGATRRTYLILRKLRQEGFGVLESEPIMRSTGGRLPRRARQGTDWSMHNCHRTLPPDGAFITFLSPSAPEHLREVSSLAERLDLIRQPIHTARCVSVAIARSTTYPASAPFGAEGTRSERHVFRVASPPTR